MNSILIILYEPPYGAGHSYYGFSFTRALSKEDAYVAVFLLADAVVCCMQGQKVHEGLSPQPQADKILFDYFESGRR